MAIQTHWLVTVELVLDEAVSLAGVACELEDALADVDGVCLALVSGVQRLPDKHLDLGPSAAPTE